jgi:hypothetical protein
VKKYKGDGKGVVSPGERTEAPRRDAVAVSRGTTRSPHLPQIAAGYASGIRLLKALPCDIFLGAHGSYFDLKEKCARWKAGDWNAFIAPDDYKGYIAEREQSFEDELKRQSATAAGSFVNPGGPVTRPRREVT